MPKAPSDELTIDELARETDVTGRNIRAFQAKGLLPPPTIRARTGYYGPEHVFRLRMIRALQEEGFRLEAIARLLDRPGGAVEHVLEFGQALRNSFGTAAPEFATTDELTARFGGEPNPRALRKAEKLGLIRSVGKDQWEIRNPTLVGAGEQLAAMGIPVEHALAVGESIDRHTTAIAKAYVRLFISDVLGGGKISESTDEDWSWLHEALERLRPMALEAIRASFENAMSQQVERQLKKFGDRS